MKPLDECPTFEYTRFNGKSSDVKDFLTFLSGLCPFSDISPLIGTVFCGGKSLNTYSKIESLAYFHQGPGFPIVSMAANHTSIAG
jgi:hypothetical protein